MLEFWNQRYAQPNYAYGKEPNTFFAQQLKHFHLKGKILFPAEGEGRNAVYAAQQGLEAYAYDLSSKGKEKALALANEKKVRIHYEVGDLPNLQLAQHRFQAAVLIYAHFPPNVRAKYHQFISNLIEPNGLIILEAFSVNNLPYRDINPDIGGPPNPEMLFTLNDIKNEFPHFDPLQLEETEVELQEGQYHRGKGMVVRFVGKKKPEAKM